LCTYLPPGATEADGTREHPFRTLERARDAVRSIRSGGEGGKKDIAVHLRGGLYTLERTFLLHPEDGGAAGHTVTYTAEEGETPVLSGGTLIHDWMETDFDGHRVWKGTLPPIGAEGADIHELWVNGRRSLQSRFPRTGYIGVDSVPGITARTDWLEGGTTLCVARRDLPPGENFLGTEAVVMNRWVESRLPVTGFDPDSSLFRFGRRSMFRLEKGDLMYFINVRSSFGEPGDWFSDRAGGVIYYIPRQGESTGSVEAIVPRLAAILRIDGSPDSGRFVSNVTFRGISFSHAGWYFPLSTGHRPRSNPEVFPRRRPAFRPLSSPWGAHDCVFEGCSFSHVGTYALELGGGCRGTSSAGAIFSISVPEGSGSVKW
jgi:hypothetical protein